MSSLAHSSPILSTLARNQLRRTSARQFRQYSSARAAEPANFASPARRIGGTMMMYFPAVAALLFWPYSVAPVMDWIAEHS